MTFGPARALFFVLSPLLVSVVGGTAHPKAEQPTPSAVSPVTADALRNLVNQSSGQPTAVLIWTAWDSRCPKCAQMLWVAGRPPAGIPRERRSTTV